jgi:AcrR family transcriptional regulator
VHVIERRRQAERSAESRQKLIASAIRLLAERGYAGTTLSGIGQASGLSRSMVRHHFGSKEQCMKAVVKSIRETVIAAGVAASPAGPPRGLAAIDLLIDTYLLPRLDAENYIRAQYSIIVESVTSTPGLQAVVAENNAIVRAMIVQWLSEAIEDGDIPEGSNLADLAVLIEGLLRGMMLQKLAEPGAVDLHRLAVITKALIRTRLAVPQT